MRADVCLSMVLTDKSSLITDRQNVFKYSSQQKQDMRPVVGRHTMPTPRASGKLWAVIYKLLASKWVMWWLAKTTTWYTKYVSWRRSIVVRTLVSTGELSLSCARLLAGWVTTLRLSCPLSVSQHGQLSQHPSGVGKWVVIHVIRYMDYGVKT